MSKLVKGKLIKPSNNRIILAAGEQHNHFHAINLLEHPDVKLYETNNSDIKILEVGEKDVVLNHEEHGAITLPAKKEYKVYIQTEYDDVEQYRKIQD